MIEKTKEGIHSVANHTLLVMVGEDEGFMVDDARRFIENFSVNHFNNLYIIPDENHMCPFLYRKSVAIL